MASALEEKSTQFATWLEKNHDSLVSQAVENLSSDDKLKPQLTDSVKRFYGALLESSKSGDLIPLYNVLIHWIEARSAPTDDDPSSYLILILVTLKDVTMNALKADAAPSEEILLCYQEADQIFTQALIYMSRLETERLLADMRGQVRDAQQVVEQVNKTKSDFIAVAAHELRTPLTVVEGYTGMMRNDPTLARSCTHLLPALDGVNSGIKRLREIIADIIDVSLIELNLLEIHFQPVWLRQILTSLERDLGTLSTGRSLNISVNSEGVPERFTYADPTRLLQVLQKVVSNAVKYTPDNGTIKVVARELSGFVDVSIEDTGIGISPDNLTHIFDPFSSQQADVSTHSTGKTKFKGGGPGLGLPIAKGIIEAHGGTLWAESGGYDEEACLGSTFHVMIPLYDQPPSEEATIVQIDRARSLQEKA